MADLLTPQEIEARAEQAGKSMKRVCAEAGVAASTFWRWKAGRTEPTLGAYRRLVAAVMPKAASNDSTPPAAASGD